MNFDKSEYISGYPITIADNDFFYDPTIENPFKLIRHAGKILKEIFSPFRPKVIIKIVPHGTFYISDDGTKMGSSLLSILNGTFDTRAAVQLQRSFGEFWKNELNLFVISGICYAIAEKTATWDQYFQQNYFLLVFIITVYIFLVIETLVIYFLKKNSSEITLDLLRALIGTATIWEPKSSFMKIIFISVLFPLIIITSFLESELTSVVIVPLNKEVKIETINDLMSNKYEVFTTDDYRPQFISTPFFNKIQTPVRGCCNSLTKNFLKACAHDCYYLRTMARVPEHTKIIPDKNLQGYWTYIFPIDYPILPRIRKIYHKLYESGIIMNILKQYEPIKIIEKINFSVIKFNELRYIFYLLCSGYLFAMIVILVEILIFKLFNSSIHRNSFIRYCFTKVPVCYEKIKFELIKK